MKVLVKKQNKEIELNYIEESGVNSIIDLMNFDYDEEKEIHTINSYEEVEEALKYLILECVEIEQEKELYLYKLDNINRICIGDTKIECSCDEKIILKVIGYAKIIYDDLSVFVDDEKLYLIKNKESGQAALFILEVKNHFMIYYRI